MPQASVDTDNDEKKNNELKAVQQKNNLTRNLTSILITDDKFTPIPRVESRVNSGKIGLLCPISNLNACVYVDFS